MASRLHVLSPKRSKRLQLVGWVEPFAKPITLPIAMPPRRWVSRRSTHPTRSQTSCDGGTLRRDPIVKKLQSLRGALATKQSISPQVQVLNISVPFFVRIGQARASRWMGHCQGPPANEFSLQVWRRPVGRSGAGSLTANKNPRPVSRRGHLMAAMVTMCQ